MPRRGRPLSGDGGATGAVAGGKMAGCSGGAAAAGGAEIRPASHVLGRYLVVQANGSGPLSLLSPAIRDGAFQAHRCLIVPHDVAPEPHMKNTYNRGSPILHEFDNYWCPNRTATTQNVIRYAELTQRKFAFVRMARPDESAARRNVSVHIYRCAK